MLVAWLVPAFAADDWPNVKLGGALIGDGLKLNVGKCVALSLPAEFRFGTLEIPGGEFPLTFVVAKT